MVDSYAKAVDSNTLGSIDSCIGFSKIVDERTAKKIAQSRFELVLAAGYDKEALEILQKNEQLKIVKINTSFEDIKTLISQELKITPFGVLEQDKNRADFNKDTFKIQTKKKPEQEQMFDIHVSEGDTDEYVEATFMEEAEVVEDSVVVDNPEKLIIQFMINLAKVGGNWSEKKEAILTDAIENSTLSDDEQLELAQVMACDKLIQIDFSSLQNDEANSAKLLEKGVVILKAEEKVALAEKLYFKKIVKLLGFRHTCIDIRNNNVNHAFLDAAFLQRFNPCFKGNIGNIEFVPHFVRYFIPFFTNKIHFKTMPFRNFALFTIII